MKKYFQAPWSLKDLFYVFLIGGSLIGLTLICFNLLEIKDYFEESQYKFLLMLGLFIFQWILLIIPFYVITNKKYKFNWKECGFNKIGIGKTIKFVLSGYFLYLGITFLITLLIFYTGLKIPGYQMQEKILPLFGDSLFSLIIAGFLIVIIAPPVEEIFFRGFVFRTLTNKTGVFFGSIISAGIFALFHLQWQSIIPIFILGLIINSLVYKSKSIWPGIYFHAFNNLIAFTIEILIFKEIISIEEIV